jgi:hypothetical protein
VSCHVRAYHVMSCHVVSDIKNLSNISSSSEQSGDSRKCVLWASALHRYFKKHITCCMQLLPGWEQVGMIPHYSLLKISGHMRLSWRGCCKGCAFRSELSVRTQCAQCGRAMLYMARLLPSTDCTCRARAARCHHPPSHWVWVQHADLGLYLQPCRHWLPNGLWARGDQST